MTSQPTTMKETERVKSQGGPGHGGPFGGGLVGQKPLTFGPSIKRLGKRLRPERPKVIAVVVAAVLSVTLFSLGPRILGRATDIIFSGVVGGFLPEGMTKEQAIDSVRAQGQDQLADMLSGVDLIPGVGIDFTALRNTHCEITNAGVIRGNHYHLQGTSTITGVGAALVRSRENGNCRDS